MMQVTPVMHVTPCYGSFTYGLLVQTLGSVWVAGRTFVFLQQSWRLE